MKNFALNNILHIDDDSCDHELFHDALRQLNDATGYIAMTDAKEALNKLLAEEISPDIIFLDLNLPKMNGQEFLNEFKKYKHLNHIPVYVFSTSSHPRTKETVKSAGANDYFTKPDTFTGLVSVLSSILL